MNVAWDATAYSVGAGIAAAVALALAGVAWRHREKIAALPVAALLTAMAGWALADAIRLGFSTFTAQFLWYRIGLTFAAVLGTTWLVFAFAYAGYEKALTRRALAVLAIEPLTFIGFMWTNGYHGLVWPDVWLVTSTTPRNLVFTFGPVYLLHILFTYLLVGAGALMLLEVYRRSSGLYRRQTLLLVIGALVPLGANIAFTLRLLPGTEIDPTPFTFTLSGIVFGLALFEFDLLDLTPVAREQLVSTLGSGLVVVNEDDRIVHVNDTAESVVPSARVGKTACEVFDVADVDELDETITATEADGSRKFYDVHVSPLVDFRGRRVGRLIAFQDVTDRREYEQRLEVSNRLLRHNLRNETTVILGWANQIERLSEDEAVRESAARIQDVAHKLGDLSEKATHIERTLSEPDGEYTTVDVATLLEGIVEMAREDWPDAVVELSAPDSAPVRVHDRTLFEVALDNLVENALEHNDAPTPRVEVSVDCGGEDVVISIADNGPEIPAFEQDTLKRGEETSLHHGSGLGLWLIHWTVDAVGGSLSFEQNEPRGNVVVLTVPRAES